MPLPGRKPQAVHRHRIRPTHDWVEVVDELFDGPPLPHSMPGGRPWPGAVKAWWHAVSRMPHCVLWSETEWRFALDTALIAAAFHRGSLSLSKELRQRERLMGTTLDARRDLRIRYVERIEVERPAELTAIEEYRRRLSR